MRIKFYIYNDKCKPRHIFPDDMDLYPTSQSINNQVVYTEIVEIRVIKNKKVDFKKKTRFLFVYFFHRFDEKNICASSMVDTLNLTASILFH